MNSRRQLSAGRTDEDSRSRSPGRFGWLENTSSSCCTTRTRTSQDLCSGICGSRTPAPWRLRSWSLPSRSLDLLLRTLHRHRCTEMRSQDRWDLPRHSTDFFRLARSKDRSQMSSGDSSTEARSSLCWEWRKVSLWVIW